MKWFYLPGRRAKGLLPQEEKAGQNEADLEPYAGMRVEVTTLGGRMLFVAKLLGLNGDCGELHQYSQSAIPQGEELVPVKIRGYSDRERQAVYMEGTITPAQQNICMVSGLKVCKAGNDRAFFRLETNLDATITTFHGLEMGEKACKLLNISIAGAYVASEFRYHEGDKFLLKVRLLEDRPESALFSQVVRVIEREKGMFEYGCQFLELTEEDQEKITQNIFAAQRHMRNGA